MTPRGRNVEGGSGCTTMDRHQTDLLSMTFALIFMAIGILFLTGRVDAGDFVRMWALPIVLVSAGLVMGAFGLARHQRANGSSLEGVPDGDDESHPPLP